MDLISKKIQELSEETKKLVYKRDCLINEIKQVDIRLTQIIGALGELQNIEKQLKGEEYEAGNDRESEIPGSAGEAKQEQAAGEDGLQAEGCRKEDQ